jgi:pimeloyl-ACP methyl ester carboxylesterase
MMAEDTAELMGALGIKTARVAGLSMGSAIAQELALAHPDMVRSLVLISSWSRCDPYTVALFEHFKRMRALASPADFTQLLQLWIAAPEHYGAHYEEMLQGQREAADGYMPLHAFQAQCDACSGHDAFDRLAQIEAPALLTVGDADIFTPLRLSAEMHERMPHSELLVFPSRGHIHHWEELEQFNARTLAFLLDH